MQYPNLKPEQTELLRIMKDYVCSETEYELPQSFFSFGPLFSLSLTQQVAPIVWHYLSSDQRALRNCPAYFSAYWKDHADQASSAQAKRESVFLEMYHVLRESGLHPLVLKGVVCRQLYSFPTLRVSCDEDILLQKDEFEEFDILIRACGFMRDEEQLEAITYIEPESDLHVEICFELFHGFSSFDLRQNAEFCDAFTHAEELEISGTEVLTFEPTKNLFFLYLHQLKHFCSKGAGIRMLSDIVAFTERYAEQIDREYLSGKLREFGLERYIGALEAIGHRYLGLSSENMIFSESSACENDISDLLEDMFAAGAYGTISNARMQSARITFAALDASAGQVSSFKKLLFPSREIMFSKYGWTGGRAFLLPAAYAVRILNAVYRSVRGKLLSNGRDSGDEWITLGNKRVEMLRKYGILDAVSAVSAKTDFAGRETLR